MAAGRNENYIISGRSLLVAAATIWAQLIANTRVNTEGIPLLVPNQMKRKLDKKHLQSLEDLHLKDGAQLYMNRNIFKFFVSIYDFLKKYLTFCIQVKY